MFKTLYNKKAYVGNTVADVKSQLLREGVLLQTIELLVIE